jgi:hypothetical protein
MNREVAAFSLFPLEVRGRRIYPAFECCWFATLFHSQWNLSERAASLVMRRKRKPEKFGTWHVPRGYSAFPATVNHGAIQAHSSRCPGKPAAGTIERATPLVPNVQTTYTSFATAEQLRIQVGFSSWAPSMIFGTDRHNTPMLDRGARTLTAFEHSAHQFSFAGELLERSGQVGSQSGTTPRMHNVTIIQFNRKGFHQMPIVRVIQVLIVCFPIWSFHDRFKSSLTVVCAGDRLAPSAS